MAAPFNPYNLKVTDMIKQSLVDNVVNNGGALPSNDQKKDSEMNKVVEENNLLYKPEQANQVFSTIRDIPEFQDLTSDIGDLKNASQELQARPKLNENGWIKPLLALADSETGSKLMSGYTEPEKQKDRDALIMKYQDAIANRRKQAADTLVSGLSKFKGGQNVYTTQGTTGTTVTNPNADLVKALMAAENRKKGGPAKETFTPLETAMDKKFADEALNFSSGGKQRVANTVARIDDLIKAVESGDVSVGWTGGIAEKIPGSKTREARIMMDDEIFPTLRQDLGAQFTEREGDLKRRTSFDTGGSKEAVARSLRELKAKALAASKESENKINYYQNRKGGASLKGYKTDLTENVDPHAGVAPSAKKKFSSEDLGF